MRSGLRRVGVKLWFPVAVLTIWEVFATAWPNPFFARPSAVVSALPSAIDLSWWSQTLLPTLALTIGGYLLGSVMGLIAGALIGMNPVTVKILGPLAVWMRSTPSVAIIPVILAIFGLGYLPLYIAVAIAVGFQILLVTMLGISRTDSRTLEAAHLLGLGHLSTLVQVRAPAAMGDMLVALHSAIQTALLVAITVEILAGGSGIGRFVMEALNSMRITHLWISVLVVGLIGVVLHELFLLLERRIAPWYFHLKGLTRV